MTPHPDYRYRLHSGVATLSYPRPLKGARADLMLSGIAEEMSLHGCLTTCAVTIVSDYQVGDRWVLSLQHRHGSRPHALACRSFVATGDGMAQVTTMVAGLGEWLEQQHWTDVRDGVRRWTP